MANHGGYFEHISDEELVVGALLGDLGALDELVRRYRSAVIIVAEQILDSRDAAEDVAQESFLLAFKALPQLREPAKFAGWICAIARRRALRVSMRDNRSKPTEESELDRLILQYSDELSANPAREFERTLESEQIQEALARLPADHRAILQLYYYEDWPVARIADFLSLPVTTIKWRLHHGRELMRRQLSAPPEETPVGTPRTPREENHHERRPPQAGDAPHPSPAPRNSRHRQTRQHHRRPGDGRAKFRPPVQQSAAISRAPR